AAAIVRAGDQAEAAGLVLPLRVGGGGDQGGEQERRQGGSVEGSHRGFLRVRDVCSRSPGRGSGSCAAAAGDPASLRAASSASCTGKGSLEEMRMKRSKPGASSSS